MNGTAHFLLKFTAIQFGQRTFFQRFFTTPVTVKQMYYRSMDYNEMRDFHGETFYMIPSCLEQLLPSYNYFVVIIIFVISYFLKTNTFSAQLLFRRSFFSRITNYSEYVLFRNGAYSEQTLFQKRNLFRGRYFLKKVTFSDSSA